MLDSLPLGEARLKRPASVFRYTFEHFARGLWRKADGLPGFFEPSVVPIEAVAAGDTQVLAAREQAKDKTPLIDLDVLAGFPAVESVIASTCLRANTAIPNLRELLLSTAAPFPDSATLRNLPALESFYALLTHATQLLNLDSLPAQQMRKLALTRWLTRSLVPLQRMNALEQLRIDLFRDSLETVAKMANLTYLSVKGPAKGWAKLRECVLLEEAHLIEVQIANLRRWNTWQRLRSLTLSGQGVKSLAGLESIEHLEQLTLLNLRMENLSPVRELSRLRELTLRMPAAGLDLASVSAIPRLRSLVIDDAAVTDHEALYVPSLKALGKAVALEELTLFCTVEDGNLLPLAELPRLQKVRLASNIGADVDALRAARPDLSIDHKPLDLDLQKLKERVGAVSIQRPGEGLEQWSIFQSLAPGLKAATNYAAESRIKKEVRKRNPELARRLDWDTEAGAVGVYAGSEADIREVADVINDLLRVASGPEAA